MKVTQLHPWDVTASEAIKLQREFASRVNLDGAFEPGAARLIAGVDVSSTRFSPLLTAGIVVWDRETGAVADTAYFQGESEFPYIPGLLSFREIPVLVRAIGRLRTTPDALLVDGQGIAHPRGMGIAAHLGLLLDLPVAGVAKSKLYGTHGPVGDAAGSETALMAGDRRIGTVLRSKARSKPLYVSPGGGMSAEQAAELVRGCLRGYRLPEPTRLAHLHVNAVRVTGAGLPVRRTLL